MKEDNSKTTDKKRRSKKLSATLKRVGASTELPDQKGERQMLFNPFTPSEIASHPKDFFGRLQELQITERSVMQGSVAIQGAIGIGKSSLMAQIRLLMEGFNSPHKSISVIAVADKDIHTVDEAARLLLEAFVHVDETCNKFKISIGKVVEIESSEVCKYFSSGRHLAALKLVLEERNMKMILEDKEYLILGIDEADKCPIPLTKLIRSITTYVQHIGVKKLRFILAGVSPYFQTMVNEDVGISRFFYKVIDLQPMKEEEATELVETKIMQVIRDAEQKGLKLNFDPSVIERVVALSGGHPHILQLLGSHLIEHENEDPDGVIDYRDLFTSLRTICYDDRAHVYSSTIHMLELYDKLDTLKELLSIAGSTVPTRIDRDKAVLVAGHEPLKWFIDHNVLGVVSASEYGLMDEFLRVRILMDEEFEDPNNLEMRLIKEGKITSIEDIDTLRNDDFYNNDD